MRRGAWEALALVYFLGFHAVMRPVTGVDAEQGVCASRRQESDSPALPQ